MPRSQKPVKFRESRSTVLHRLARDKRLSVDRAIFRREPVTLLAVYDQFDLAGHGISLSAFYRYARRLRQYVALFELADLTDPGGAATSNALRTALAYRFLENVEDDRVSPDTLYRLARTQRLVASTDFSERRAEARELTADAPSAPEPAASQ